MKTTTKIYDSIVYADNMELYETTRKKKLEALSSRRYLAY